MRYSITNATIEQVESVGAKNLKPPRHIPVMFAELTPTQVAELQSMGCTVSEVGEVKVDILPPSPVEAVPTYSPEQLSFVAGLEDFRDIFEPALYGEGFNIAIIDTGIRETHEKLNGQIIYSKNYTSSPMGDGFDHGTGVASIVVPIAPLCGILNLKVISDEGTGTEEAVVLAIDDCIELYQEQSELAPSVINLSLGAPDNGDPNTPIRIACRAAIDIGIWILAAAGNQGPSPGTVTSPACERYVGAVGSIGFEPFVISEFSSRGPTLEGLTKPDGVVFGEDIIVASSSSDTAVVAKSGTSFSCPFASAIVIIYTEGTYRQAVAKREFWPGAQKALFRVTEQELLDTYLPLICLKPEGVAAGKDNEYGHGLPYGPLAANALGLVPGLDISSLITGVMMIGMMGMIMGIMKK